MTTMVNRKILIQVVSGLPRWDLWKRTVKCLRLQREQYQRPHKEEHYQRNDARFIQHWKHYRN